MLAVAVLACAVVYANGWSEHVAREVALSKRSKTLADRVQKTAHLRGLATALQAQLDEVKADLAQCTGSLDVLEASSVHLSSELAELRAQAGRELTLADGTAAEVAEATAAIARTRAGLDEVRSELKAQIVESMGREGRLSSGLNLLSEATKAVQGGWPARSPPFAVALTLQLAGMRPSGRSR